MHTKFMNIIILLFFATYNAERIRYISTEHPAVTSINLKYMSYLNITSRRYGRDDPFYYVNMNWYLTSTFGNNVSVHFYFYEFLSNTYRRGFVEMHFKFCDLIEKDMFFGYAMRTSGFPPCPTPPGPINASNMTIPIKQIPPNFPFTKGRIYCNMTTTATDEMIASGHIDMEIKEERIKKNKKIKKQENLSLNLKE